MYDLAIFDMDGTIADTSLGIINSHRYAHKIMGRPVPSEEILYSVIGGPLLQTYTSRFGFSEPEARSAVAAYRDYYSNYGIHEASLYPGIEQTLKELFCNGVKLAMATLKKEEFSKIMLKKMGILNFFTVIYGMDKYDTRTKSQLIEMCMNTTGIPKDNSIMIGDSIHDLNGAKTCGISFLGVTYGFGFLPNQEYNIQLVSSAKEITRVVTDSNI
ncbi:hypothetical protein B5G34_16240 [Flavonifractor sp. An82]|uniref:HAD-IA family hydrolase n=1 Tax=Flavonifractor sp. An82 TaxID=1965660 RepID=UPI000B3AD4BF|nr:HAD-IA family hydrolase [Flavonifractor sp. An82]OUN20036.1 hypothetical protein B5G34_16240 [Flavonifractor sp. An82]